ncbi:SPOR domain-containing protein [Candidatus Zixiibacteriota bacterium]
MKKSLTILILLSLLLAFACTPLPPKGGGQTGELAEAERDFDPLAQDRNRPITIVPGEGSSNGDQTDSTNGTELDLNDDPADPGRQMVTQGYRVQIFLSDDLREASRIMAEARERFEEEVYLEYDAPYYKVRVGDYGTESEGDGLLKIAQRLGYGDAWLVRTVISVPQERQSP